MGVKGMTFGAYIASLRRKKGLSQAEVAEACHVTAAEISRIENGIRQKISPNIIRHLSDILDCDYAGLMETAGYTAEKSEREKTYEMVFRDEKTGEIVDVERGAREMFRNDAQWANAAFRVSRELSEQDRRAICDITLAYLNAKKNGTGGETET